MPGADMVASKSALNARPLMPFLLLCPSCPLCPSCSSIFAFVSFGLLGSGVASRVSEVGGRQSVSTSAHSAARSKTVVGVTKIVDSDAALRCSTDGRSSGLFLLHQRAASSWLQFHAAPHPHNA